jgi:hypothetical protein
MEIPFKGQYTQSEFRRGVQLAGRTNSRNRFGGLMLVAALAAVVFLSGQSFYNGAIFTDPFMLVRIGLALLLLAAYLLFDPIRAYLQTRRLWQNPAMQQPITGRVTIDGLTYTNVSPYRNVPWSRFARLRLNKDLAALLTQDGVLTLLPKRFFKSEKDWEAAVKVIRSKVAQ